VDEEDRRYFKQQEIILWRKPPRKKGEAKDDMVGRYEREADIEKEHARKAALDRAEADIIARETVDEQQTKK
jgi:hypothetical protein